MSGGFMSGLTDRFRSTEDITKGLTLNPFIPPHPILGESGP